MQRGHEFGPPQSSPVSVPFTAPSGHAGTWQIVPVQTFDVQSLPLPQCLPSAQGPQVSPPQFRSVSLPFLTASAQLGAWHTVEHTPLKQSAGTLHVVPVAHPSGHPPPQSTAFSLPFLVKSVHVAA
jgi:hypothetical protein